MVFADILQPIVESLRQSVSRSLVLVAMVTAVVGGCVVNGSHDNGPWLCFTLVTTGLIFLSYYLGGILNSKCISDEEYRSHAVLRLQSQVRLLPISKMIRKQARQAERERLRGIERRISVCGRDPFRNQGEFLIEAILDGYVLPWYNQVSDERLFPMEVQLLLQEILSRLRKKVENVRSGSKGKNLLHFGSKFQLDRTAFMVEVVQILHSHWNEYCDAVKKIRSPNELLIHNFRLAHEYIDNREDVRKQYESLLSNFLPELLPSELQAPILSKFLAGILVKGVFLYYADLLTDPNWLNTTLVTLISSGNYVSASDTCSNTSGSNFSSTPLTPSSNGGSTPFKETVSCEDERFMNELTARVNFLETTSKPGVKERSVETALTGLLSTTALPLLPDGVLYYLKLKDIDTAVAKVAFPTSPSTSQRHKSWEESSSNAKVIPEEAAAHSFDESKNSTVVLRQSEFDYGMQSPAYEEAEDFAATIAKLRSLLEQRESQTNMMEGMSGNDEIGAGQAAGGAKKGERARGVLDSQSSGSSNGSAPAQATFEPECKLEKIEDEEDDVVEEDEEPNQFFQDVKIPKTESCGDNADQFTLYCIQYTGVYVEREHGESTSPKLFLRTTTVKRSLNEFLLLQTQLEKHPDRKRHLRGIKSHNSWLSLPFTHRRILLQRYLQQLCAHPVLGFCPELCQFMAYGDDGFQMYAPLPNRAKNLPRFDRLTKTFTGVLNSLKDVLPSFADDDTAESVAERNEKPKKRLQSFFQFGPHKTVETQAEGEAAVRALVERIKRQSHNYLPNVAWQGANRPRDVQSDNSTDDDEKNTEESESDADEVQSNCTVAGGDLLSPRPDSSLDTLYPLASAVTRFLCDVLWLPEQRPKNASVSAVMSVSGKSLEKYLSESLDILISEDAFVGYMEMVTGAIRDWTVATSGNQDQLNFSEDDLKLCLKQRLPSKFGKVGLAGASVAARQV